MKIPEIWFTKRKKGDSMEFSSVKELYERLVPALKTKCKELRRINYYYIKEEDIWNYLKEYKWKKTSNLNLFEMVEDILNIDILKLDSYVKEQYRISKREINLKEE